MSRVISAIDPSMVTLAVLAGGFGRRMGVPKAWLRIGGEPILAWLLTELQWPGPTMLVMAPSVTHPPAEELFDQCVSDPVDGQGPLRGIATALHHAATPLVVVVTVDMPAIKRCHLTWLAQTLAGAPTIEGLMCVPPGDQDRIEPFPSAFRKTAAQLVAHRVESGRRSVQDLCSEPAFSAVRPPPNWTDDAWTNLNFPEDLGRFQSEHHFSAVEETQ